MKSIPLTLMTILIGVSIQSLQNVVERVKISLAQSQLRTIGRFIKVDAIAGPIDKTIQKNQFSLFLQKTMERGGANGGLDPWGRPFKGQVIKRDLILSSDGPDKIKGTDDDVREVVQLPQY